MGQCSAPGGVGHGGGVYGNAAVSLRSCVLMGNSTPYWSEGKGGGAFACGEIVNCTVTGNTARTAGGGVFGGNVVKNSILYGNSAPTGANISGTSTVTYSNVGGGHTGEGNINADPGFVDAYHISAGSPCINGGDPDFVFGDDEKDIDGQHRVIQGRVDMGADEVEFEATALDAWPVTLHFEGSPIEEIDAQEIRIQNAGTGNMAWQAIEDCPWLTLSSAAGESSGDVSVVAVTVDASALTPGTYTCTIMIDAGAAIRSPANIAVQLICRPVDAVWAVPQHYSTIQQAIDLAEDGETVLVADGVYTGTGNTNIDFKGKAITVRSVNGPDNCIIDCQNVAGRRGFYLHSGEGADSVIKGFTVTRGYANGHPARGGAILCEGAAPTIEDCILIANKAQPPRASNHYHGSPAYGGALYCTGTGTMTISNCKLTDNVAAGAVGYDVDEGAGHYITGKGGDAFGGAIYVGSGVHLTVDICQVRSNRAIGADGGGGMPDEFAVWVDAAGGGEGGGLYAADNSSVQIRNSIFADNSALGGAPGISEGGFEGPGGVFLGAGLRLHGAEMSRCIIDGNKGGSGIYHVGDVLVIENCLLTGSLVNLESAAWGVALESDADVFMRNCTVAGNPTPVINPLDPSPAVYVRGNGSIRNCIMWSNEGNDVGGYHILKAVTHSCTEQVIAGEGNIHGNPLFVTGPDGAYYLSQVAAGQMANSPCVDAGNGLAADPGLGSLSTRTDGVRDAGLVDMGYHYSAAFNAGDLNADGVVDMSDWGELAQQWDAQLDGCIPDNKATVSGDLNGDCAVDFADLLIFATHWLDR
ncbi:MAG: hypothetical protein IH624_09970 [Phycisphaerae bacterium]|nr:hypothetical protein [Phycisphaerae bacterium]